MYLTSYEERVLVGEEGWAKAKALEVVVKVGEALRADRLQPIVHAHVSGVSYYNIGEPGLRLLEDLARSGGRFSVPTTVNPIGFDLDNPRATDVVELTEDLINGQYAIIRALRSMGARLTFTCTPYYIPDVRGVPRGSSVAWGESSAVVYANSVLGLRTNREGGPLALMAGIAGRTYLYGMHIDQERVPRVAYRLEAPDGYEVEGARAGVLGEVLAARHRARGPPLLRARLDLESFKELAAAVGAAGDIPMVFVPGLSPEREPEAIEGVEVIDYREVERRLEELAPPDEVDIVYIGCPHVSASTLERLASLLSRGTPRGGGPRLLVTISRAEEARVPADVMGTLRRYGAVLVRDTCLVVTQLKGGLRVATDSYKAYFYLSRKGVRVGVEPLESLARRLAS
ncbi:MAG: aconitase X catalytic domain-containing protein [Acidilobus sp.]